MLNTVIEITRYFLSRFLTESQKICPVSFFHHWSNDPLYTHILLFIPRAKVYFQKIQVYKSSIIKWSKDSVKGYWCIQPRCVSFPPRILYPDDITRVLWWVHFKIDLAGLSTHYQYPAHRVYNGRSSRRPHFPFEFPRKSGINGNISLPSLPYIPLLLERGTHDITAVCP